jgi:hypothetical protein
VAIIIVLLPRIVTHAGLVASPIQFQIYVYAAMVGVYAQNEAL